LLKKERSIHYSRADLKKYPTIVSDNKTVSTTEIIVIITLRIIRAFFGLVASSGAIHFIFVISSFFSTVIEEELKILPNMLMLK